MDPLPQQHPQPNGAGQNAANGTTKTPDLSRFDPKFTQNVIDAIGPNTPPRTRLVFASLIRHLHDFAREVELTTEEWLQGVRFVNSIGQISTAQRNEAHRMSDIFGLESLVVEIANKAAVDTPDATTPTSSAILGPFWSPNAPFRQNGDSVIQSPHKGLVTLMHGTVTDLVTKRPIANAVVDLWQASSNGKYDFQDPENQSDNNLRGKFRTDAEGRYWLYCLRPTAYSLPTDGPAGEIFRLLDRHPMRPAHIHLMITADGYKSTTTQIYPDDDPYVENDTVFAVKGDLIVHFSELGDDPHATRELEYDIVLLPKA